MAWMWIGGTVGDWTPDHREPSGWRYDKDAPSPGRNPALTQILPVVEPYPDPGPGLSNSNPPAETAGEQDHSDPWLYAGEDADPPGAVDGLA